MESKSFHSPFEDEAFLVSREALPKRPRRHLDALHGSARLANAADLALWVTPDPREKHVTQLARFNPLVEDLDTPEGLRAWFNQTLFFREEQRNRHLLIIGQPGSGKTQGFILPLLWSDLGDHERSVIVFDAKGELARFTRLAARERGRTKPVLVVNFADRTRSLGWNPLETLPTDPAQLESKAFELAYTLCWATEVRENCQDSIFFITSAINLLTGLIMGVVLDPAERPSLPRVRELLELPRGELIAWLKEHGHIPGIAAFLSYITTASWNAETVLADAQMRLSAFRDLDLSSVMSKNELDLDQLVDEAGVLVVEMREADTPRLRPIWNLFCTFLMDHFTARAAREPLSRLPRPVALILDEFASSLGRLPKFDTAVNTLRQPRVGIVAAVQSLAQIGHLYRGARDSVLAGFSSKIFLAGLERVDAEYASALSGTMSAEQVTTIEEEDKRKPGTFRVTARHRSSSPRPLLNADEIARPPKHFVFGAPATFFLAETPPFQAYFVRAFELDGPREILRAIEHEPRTAAQRPIPLLWRPTRRVVASVGRTVPQSVLQARFHRLKNELAFERASAGARAWWSRLEKRHETTVSGLVELLEELKELSSSLDDLHGAHRMTCHEEPRVLANYVRYLRSVKELDALDQLSLGWPPQPDDGAGDGAGDDEDGEQDEDDPPKGDPGVKQQG
ncbi:MAG: type IV secretory system conjugative DNA transfer family protein [Planctomycetes bacterium]|nr:type IV secretory system conjugative DNA transfer family protein [Planctomycetota bacterium]